jgi:hypothetical protein
MERMHGSSDNNLQVTESWASKFRGSILRQVAHRAATSSSTTTASFTGHQTRKHPAKKTEEVNIQWKSATWEYATYVSVLWHYKEGWPWTTELRNWWTRPQAADTTALTYKQNGCSSPWRKQMNPEVKTDDTNIFTTKDGGTHSTCVRMVICINEGMWMIVSWSPRKRWWKEILIKRPSAEDLLTTQWFKQNFNVQMWADVDLVHPHHQLPWIRLRVAWLHQRCWKSS